MKNDHFPSQLVEKLRGETIEVTHFWKVDFRVKLGSHMVVRFVCLL